MELGAKERAARHERFCLIESVIPMIGGARYSNRADMEASHGREIFPRKI